MCWSTGNYGSMLHDILDDRGIYTLLAHSAKIKAIAQSRPKDGRINSAILTDLLMVGTVHGSFVLDRDTVACAACPGTYRHGRAGTDAKNQITATMAKYDYRSPTKRKSGGKGLASLRSADVLRINTVPAGAWLEVSGRRPGTGTR